MIKHIVLWKLHEEADGKSKAENAAIFKSRLEALPSKIKEIQSFEVGVGYKKGNDGPVSDMVLISTHHTREDLEAYAVHPEHLKVAVYAQKIVAERRVVDCEL